MTGTPILRLLARIAEAQSIDDVWAVATVWYASLGFARANYGFTRFRHAKTIGDPDDALFLTTCDDEYARRYFRGGFYARTPVFRWAERNSGACTWKWVSEAFAAGRLSAEETQAVRQNIAIGVTAGLSLSFPEASARAKGAMGLIANPGLSTEDVERIWAANQPEIIAVAHMMHLKIIQLPQLSRTRALSMPCQRAAPVPPPPEVGFRARQPGRGRDADRRPYTGAVSRGLFPSPAWAQDTRGGTCPFLTRRRSGARFVEPDEAGRADPDVQADQGGKKRTGLVHGPGGIGGPRVVRLRRGRESRGGRPRNRLDLSLIHISEPTRPY